jgi:hypothetical protein
MLTADSITNEQILDLLGWLEDAQETANFALLGNEQIQTETLRDEVKKARARCAEIIDRGRLTGNRP